MEVRQHSIGADFLCQIAVMHPYECISGNKSRACSLAWMMDPGKAEVQPTIIVIIVIIVLIVLSVSRLIAIIGNNSQ